MKILYVASSGRGERLLRGKPGMIHTFHIEVNPKTSLTLKEIATTASAPNPNFLHSIRRPEGTFFYATTENASKGELFVFKRSESGTLDFLREYSTKGSCPCYVTTDKSGRFLLLANYMSGSVLSYSIKEEGCLEEISFNQWHESSGVVASRQERPHAHCIVADWNNRFIYAADLGADKIWIYRLMDDGQLIANESQKFISTPPGSGPRHVIFHPQQPLLYISCELSSTVMTFQVSEDGSLLQKQTLSTLPAEFEGASDVAEIQLTPDARFLYVSNRGHDSLAIFEVNSDGKLSPIGHNST